jgi:hypothetical protein
MRQKTLNNINGTHFIFIFLFLQWKEHGLRHRETWRIFRPKIGIVSLRTKATSFFFWFVLIEDFIDTRCTQRVSS